MKTIPCLLMVFSFVFTAVSCGSSWDEEIDNEEEALVFVDWSYAGWEEVYNDTDSPVTLIMSYPEHIREEVLKVGINPGEFARLEIGCMAPGEEFNKCTKATFLLGGGEEMVISPKMDDAWSERFLTNVESRTEHMVFEVLLYNSVREYHRDMIVRTYHYNNELIDLWRSSLGE